MIKKLVVSILVLLILLPALAGCQRQPTTSRILSERLVDQIDFSSWEELSFTVSPDCKRIAYMATRGDKSFVVIDGQESKQYAAIWSLIFSPDSSRVAYTAGVGSTIPPMLPREAGAPPAPLSQFVVVDGIEGKRYDLVSNPFFSADSQKLVYTAQEGENWFLVVNGVEVKQFDGTMPSKPIFSPDCERVAYVANVDNKEFVVVDGKEGKLYDHVNRPFFSSNSQHLFYTANLGGQTTEGLNKWFLVLDGEEITKYDECDEITFSPDGQRVAYVAKVDKNAFVVVDGVEGRRYGGSHEQGRVFHSYVGELTFSPDSQKVVYVAMVDSKEVVVVDGIEGRSYDRVGCPIFTSDSQRLAYTAKEGDKWFLVVNGVEEKQFDGIMPYYDPTFSSDCKRVAYKVSWNFLGLGDVSWYEYYMVVDGEEGKKYDVIMEQRRMLHGVYYWYDVYDQFLYHTPSAVFSPDSQHVAYTARDGNKVFVVVDGEEGKKYDFLNIYSKVPSTIWGWGRRKSGDPQLGSVVFDSADRLHYLAAKDNRIYLVEEVLK